MKLWLSSFKPLFKFLHIENISQKMAKKLPFLTWKGFYVVVRKQWKCMYFIILLVLLSKLCCCLTKVLLYYPDRRVRIQLFKSLPLCIFWFCWIHFLFSLVQFRTVLFSPVQSCSGLFHSFFGPVLSRLVLFCPFWSLFGSIQSRHSLFWLF